MVERASKLFDNLIVSVGANSSKKPMLSTEQRIEALRRSTHHLPNVKVDSFQGLLVEYVDKKGASAIIRGLRATADFEYEFQMAMVNRRLNRDVETLFLMTTWEHSYLSSSIVREVAMLGGDYKGMVPAGVAEMMAEALGR